MQRISVRCFLTYAKCGELYNNPVYIVDNGAWANFTMGICAKCGDLFAFHVGDDSSQKRSKPIRQTAKERPCPKCGSKLGETLQNYPETYLATDGAICQYESLDE